MVKKEKAVIFDLGGVLLRTIDPTPRIALAKRFLTTRQELERLVFHSQSSIESELGNLSDEIHWQWVLDHFSQKKLDPVEVNQQFFSGDILDQELMAFVRKIKGQCKTGLLSNAWQNARRSLSERYNFLDDFDVSIFSSEVGLRKPDPQIFYLILDQLGMRSNESVFIDDFQQNIDAAVQIGMNAILFTNTKETIDKISSLI